MLYIVSTPIGNPDDITLRAVQVLREASAVICEEERQGGRLLHHYQIENALVALNEHTERERIPELLGRLKRGEMLALISDHGTPLLADPGARLVERAIAAGIDVRAVPGASSVLAALVVSGLPMDRFLFAGMLPVKREERRRVLGKLKEETATWVVLEAPYRLNALLSDLVSTLGRERPIVVACNLTLPIEQIVRGTAAEVTAHFKREPFKGEFVVIVAGHRR